MGFVPAAAAAPLIPPPLYPVLGAIYIGQFAALLYVAYQQKQKKQEKLSEQEKAIAAKEYFAQKVTYEWNEKIKQRPARKTGFMDLKNVDTGKEEYSFVMVGDLDNRTFSHIAVSKLNNFRQGSFHILARHYSQFRSHLHVSWLPHLSPRALSLLEECERARNRQQENHAYDNLQKYLESTDGVTDGMVLDEMQFTVFHYLRSHMNSTNFAGYIVDDHRRISYHFRIGTKMLRVVFSKEVYYEHPGIMTRKFKEIITAYFIDPKSVDGKLVKPSLPMKRRRREYFVSYIF